MSSIAMETDLFNAGTQVCYLLSLSFSLCCSKVSSCVNAIGNAFRYIVMGLFNRLAKHCSLTTPTCYYNKLYTSIIKILHTHIYTLLLKTPNPVIFCITSVEMVQYDYIFAQTVVIKHWLTWLQNNIKRYEPAVVSIATTAPYQMITTMNL